MTVHRRVVVKSKEYVVWFNVAVRVQAQDQQQAERRARIVIDSKKDDNVIEANLETAYPMPTGE